LIFKSFLILFYLGLPIVQAKTLSGSFPKNFARLLDTLDKKALARVKAGYSLFSKPWVQAPSSTFIRDGLGPQFNATSCISCHSAMGRGAPPGVLHKNDPSLIFKVLPHKDNTIIESIFGAQISPNAIQGVKTEASISKNNDFNYVLKHSSYGPLEQEFYLSPRISPHLAGLGIIEKIKESELIINSNNGGIINYLKDGSIGKFGWKADHSRLESQIAAAFRNDMGITNHLFPTESCSNSQTKCLTQLSGNNHEGVEISKKHLSFVVELIQSIKPPKRIFFKNISAGKKIFKEIGCTSCHRSEYIVDGLIYSPYSDFLLHDMGDFLADKSNNKNARLWKTPPLWGIGSMRKVNGHTRLLHDGRAKSIEEAILFHAGEATDEKSHYLNLTAKEKKIILDFIKSL
jgi:CxxC motif-containing protein (DUF1111 family)